MVSKDQLKAIVIKHTKPGSRHQAEALKMLDAHYKRFDAEIKPITCDDCGETVDDCVRWSENGIIADTWGYTEEANKNICFHCDNFGFIGDIFWPKRLGH